MANLDFYAVREDMLNLLKFIYAETDCRVFESYSRFDQSLREFTSAEQLLSAYDIGRDPHGNGHAVLLELWSPSVSSRVKIERIALNPQKCDGHTFRYNVTGWGLMQLYLGGEHDGAITHSHFGHNSLKRAQAWETTLIDEVGPVSEWDWDLLMKVSRKIQYHIRKRLAASKVDSRPILREANRKLAEDYSIKKY